MSNLSASTAPEMVSIAQAYLEVRDGFSIDRVVADPLLDRKFLKRCRELNLLGTDFDLNWKLFNGRKNKFFSDLPPTKNYTVSKKDDFEFSSEIAVRHVQELVRLRDGESVSLDKIICDPDLVSEFDSVAERLAPGFTPLDYRWVALGVRKAAGRYGSKAEKVDLPKFEALKATKSIRATELPTDQGLYLFRCDNESLFVGDTDNLRHRIEKHFDTGGINGLPDWLYDTRSRVVSLGVFPMPNVTSTSRKIVELGAIQRLRPLFNYIGSRAA
jgi:site-specific DNA-methyltransferase (adenine-specific)